MARILVADDDADLLWVVRCCLAGDGHEVTVVTRGAGIVELVRRRRPDLVILDIVMPGLDGLEVCRRLKREPRTATVPILFLTAKGAIEDRLHGLDSGGDDYLVKPFDVRELQARVRVLLRRSRPAPGPRVQPLVAGSLTLDAATYEVHVNERVIPLTSTQFKLLYHLMWHAGRVVSEEELLQQVWGYPLASAGLGLVRGHVKKLRERIEPDPAHPVYIRTVFGHGYRLVAPADAQSRGGKGSSGAQGTRGAMGLWRTSRQVEDRWP